MSFLLPDSHLISTRDAAKLSGYHSDYLGRLCREGKIAASRVGRAWLVDHASLVAFIAEQELAKKEHAEELARQREREYQEAQSRTSKSTPAPAQEPQRSPYAPVPSPYREHPLIDRTVAAAIAVFSVGFGLWAADIGLVSGAAHFSVEAAESASAAGYDALNNAGASLIAFEYRLGDSLLSSAGSAYSSYDGAVAAVGSATRSDLVLGTASAAGSALRDPSPQKTAALLRDLQLALGDSVIGASRAILSTHEAVMNGWAQGSREVPPRVITAFYGIGVEMTAVAVAAPREVARAYDEAILAWVDSAPRVAERLVGVQVAFGSGVMSVGSGEALVEARNGLARTLDTRISSGGPRLALAAVPEADILSPLRSLALYMYESLNRAAAAVTRPLAVLFAPQAPAIVVLPGTEPERAEESSSATTVSRVVNEITNYITTNPVTYVYSGVTREYVRQAIDNLRDDLNDRDDDSDSRLADLTGSSLEDLGDVASMTKDWGDLLFWNGSEWADLATSSLGIAAGSGTPGGNDTEVQFNDSGAFAGSPSFTFNTSTARLAVDNLVTANATTTNATSTNSYALSLTAGSLVSDGLNVTGSGTIAYASSTAVSADVLCIGMDCRTSWPSGGGAGGSIATSTSETAGYVPFWTSTNGTPAALGSDSGFQYSAAADRLTIGYASSTAVSASYASTTRFGINGETFTNLVGAGLQNVAGALTINATGDWTGTFDGQEGSYYLSRANHTGSQTASTISDFNAAVASYINGSSTILSNATETGLEAFLTDVTNVFTNNDGALADDDLTNNSIEDLSDVAAMTENFGDLLYWNGSAWADIATSSLGITTGLATYDAWTHPAAGQSATTSLMLFNGAASSTQLSATQAYFGGTATSTFTSAGFLGIGTSSPFGLLSVEQGTEANSLWVGNSGSSTPSLVVKGVNGNGRVGLGTDNPTTQFDVESAGVQLSSTNFMRVAEFIQAAGKGIVLGFDSSSQTGIIHSNSLGTASNLAFWTYSGGADFAERARISSGGNFGIGTTSPYAKLSVVGQVVGANFTATTSATSTFPTLAATIFGFGSDYFTDLTGTGLQNVGGALSLSGSVTDDDLTDNSVEDLSDVAAMTENYGDLLGWNGSSWIDFATSTLGLPTFADLASSYPFSLTGNATSSLTQFNGGLTAYASSTIGNGAQGLTISGAATTTGRAYFGGSVGVGTTTPDANLNVYGSTGIKVNTSTGGAQLQLGDRNIANYGNQFQYVNFGGSNAGDDAWQIGKNSNGTSLAPSKGFYIYDLVNSLTRFVIGTNGSVGIGTTSPSRLLQISTASASASSTLRFTNGSTGFATTDGFEIGVGSDNNVALWSADNNSIRFATNNIERMRIKDDGNISIGTTTILIDGNGTSFNRLLISGEPGGVGAAGLVAVGGNVTGTADPVGSFVFTNQSLSTTEKRIALISGSTDGATNSGAIRFQTMSAGSISEKMRIDKNGNVGIGTTTSPSLLYVGTGGDYSIQAPDFMVSKAGRTTTAIRDSTNNIEMFSMVDSGSSGVGYLGMTTAHPLRFVTNNTDQMTILSGGNVGIGSTNPTQAKLVIGGTDNGIYTIGSVTDGYFKSTATGVRVGTPNNGSVSFATNDADRLTIAAGGSATIPDYNLFVCTGGACPTGSPAGNGNIIAETTVGVGTSTPWAGLSIVSGKALVVAENTLATSTSMTVDWRNGNQQLVRLGTAGTTISFSGFIEGQKLVLTVCNPGATAGAISWGTQVLWAGGTAPTQTTTANKCDVWSFLATAATSTVKIFGTQSANF